MLHHLFLFLCIAGFGFCEKPIPSKPPHWDSWTWNQKIIWRGKHLDPRIDYAQYVDKLRAKAVMQNDVPVAKCLYIVDIPDLLNVDKLPSTYVMKANNGANRNLIVKNGLVVAAKRRVDLPLFPANRAVLQQFCQMWLNTPYRPRSERQYALIEPKVFFEDYLNNITYELQLHTFYGKVQFIAIRKDLNKSNQAAFYSPNWERLAVTRKGCTEIKEDIPKPLHLDTLIAVTEKYTKKIDYVRVDYYLCQDDYYFSEFTFTPTSGHAIYYPQSFDYEMAKFWPYPRQGALQ